MATTDFNYCPLVWHFCGKTLSKKLEKIQERGLRFVYNDANSPYLSLLDKAHLPTLNINRLRTLAAGVYKALTGQGPVYLQDMFQENLSTRQQRHFKFLNVPTFRNVTFGKYSLLHEGVKIWNQLPNSIKSTVSYKEFKNLISTWHFEDHCTCLGCAS